MNRFLLLITILIFSITSCQQEDPDPVPVPDAFDYYIAAKVDNIQVSAFSNPGNSPFGSSFDPDQRMVQFQRYVSENTTQGWNFFINNLDLDNITYPKTIKYTNFSTDPLPEVIYNNGMEGAKGNFVVNNLDSNLFSITINSYTNDVIEGTFSGKLRWGSGYDSTLTFTDGEFKVPLFRYDDW